MNTLVLSAVMALLWMTLVQQFDIQGFIVGYIFGLAIVLVVRSNTSFDEDREPIRLAKIPSQLVSLVVYIGKLAFDVFMSGLDVASKVIQPEMPINPKIYRVPTQDDKNSSLVSALSAHSITITPGESVIDFTTDDDGNTIMLVHVLDEDASTPEKLKHDQTARLRLIRQILGQDNTGEGA